MNDISSVASVGTNLAQFRTQYQAAVMAKQQEVVQGIGAAVIRLIQTALVNPELGNNINMTV
ncbi:MAG TPA: hypothetical protein PLJ71_12165 [Candidatus Hydrogenedentes bacterium]|nr:hypothetical protein [Candidatus Hydrogenedentota bacterium]HQM49433.1 hypothetical protein [Candidatus Hydrogenedentota bacterium]